MQILGCGKYSKMRSTKERFNRIYTVSLREASYNHKQRRDNENTNKNNDPEYNLWKWTKMGWWDGRIADTPNAIRDNTKKKNSEARDASRREFVWRESAKK